MLRARLNLDVHLTPPHSNTDLETPCTHAQSCITLVLSLILTPTLNITITHNPCAHVPGAGVLGLGLGLDPFCYGQGGGDLFPHTHACKAAVVRHAL